MVALTKRPFQISVKIAGSNIDLYNWLRRESPVATLLSTD
jgi:hypothetical protein